MNPGLTSAAEAPIVAFKASLKSRSPSEVFDMSQAVPSYATFPPIVEGLKRDLDSFGTGFYTPVEGIAELRSAIVEFHPLSDALEPRDVFVTAGANHAMYTALSALLAPGDRVTLLEPFYFNYDMALSMLGLVPDYFALSAEKGFQPDAAALLSHLEAARSRALILITPNNPTGAVYDASVVERIVDGCARLGIEVLLDETYAAFDPNHLASAALGKFVHHNLTLVGSFSKSFSLTGYRVGYLTMAHERAKDYLKLQDTMIICASHIGQRAALHGLNLCRPNVAEKTGQLAQKAAVIEKYFSTPRDFRLRSVGPFFAYVEHPYDLGAWDAATCLYETKGILSLPGSVFGKSQDRYLRLAYENLSLERLAEAVAHL